MGNAKLVSDFRETYDSWFDLDGTEFRRVTTDGPSRVEMFTILESLGYHVPPHGSVQNTIGRWWEQEHCWLTNLVIYDDLYSHCGNNKRLMSESQIKWDGNINRLHNYYDLQNKFCSAFIGKFGNPTSFRLLKIGTRIFWLEYQSDDLWRSNCGAVEAKIVDTEIAEDKLMQWPLLAIDFVIGKEMYAVDFNVAPGIRGIGLENYLSNKEIVDLIKENIADNA